MKKYLFPAAAAALVLALLLGLFPVVLSADGGAPVAENLDISTYRGVSVGGLLRARDPEGDTLRFEVTTKPGKGKMDLDADGHFVYTPADGKRVKDYFGFRAIDSDGNASQEGTVIIRIQKQRTAVTYADMAGSASECAAVRLAESGVFTGAEIAGVYVFCPDEPVRRSEFLAMCMRAAGTETLSSMRATGFADDAEIAVWARPYVASALRSGLIAGYSGAGGVSFRPEEPVSVQEAAVILDRALALTDAVPAWFGYDGAIPAWAKQACANVSSCGLLPDGCSFSDAALSRADAAVMLSAAMDVLARR